MGEQHHHSKLLDSILDTLALPVFVLDIDSIVYLNHAAAKLLSCPNAKALRGMPVATIIHEDSHDATAERRRLVILNRNQFKSVCLKLKAFDGSVLRLTSDVKPLDHDGQVLVMATITDVAVDR